MKPHIYTEYHVFSNGSDEWFKNKKDALELFNEWKKGVGCARLYEEKRRMTGMGDENNGELLEENCIKSFGPWPF